MDYFYFKVTGDSKIPCFSPRLPITFLTTPQETNCSPRQTFAISVLRHCKQKLNWVQNMCISFLRNCQYDVYMSLDALFLVLKEGIWTRIHDILANYLQNTSIWIMHLFNSQPYAFKKANKKAVITIHFFSVLY